MKKLLLLLLVVPLISKAQVENELILNTITIDSLKLDLVSFSYSDELKELTTDEAIIATQLKYKKMEEDANAGYIDYNCYDWITFLRLLPKKDMKRLKSEIKAVKKFKDISFRKIFNDYVIDYIDEDDYRLYYTPIEITYNIYGDHKFGIRTLEGSRILIPFDIESSIKYGRYFFGCPSYVNVIDYDFKPFYLTTDLDGMERFITFLENK